MCHRLPKRSPRLTLSMMALLSISLIFSGCFLQPKTETIERFNFIDYDAPAIRLAEPVKAKLLIKNEKGEWVPAGKGELPAGAYVKGRKPPEEVLNPPVKKE